MVTEKQLSYVMLLLERKGFHTHYMNLEFLRFGAPASDCTGNTTVESWVRKMKPRQCSMLINAIRNSY
jgi:hypothetical protein